MHSEAILVLLFSVATAVAILVRRLRVPYTVGLVIAGLALGFLGILPAPQLTKELLFTVFLPGLLFEAAFHVEFHDFRRNWVAIICLALPGVVVAIAATVAILTPVADALDFVSGFTWQHALVFGALIAASDPIAVIAIFRRLGTPSRLAVLLDGESLLNDGTAVVLFTLSLELVSGRQVAIAGLLADFVRSVGLGALVGGVVGLTISQVIQRVDDAMIEITLTSIAAYGSFAAAEQLHASGVIATVVAGILCGNFGARQGMSPSTRVAAETFWEYVAFALNSFVFLLIGFAIRLEQVWASWEAILVAYLAVTIGRGAVLALVSGLLRPTRERIPWRWTVVLTWGGLRGAVPMVLVLSLPHGFPHRDLLVSMTFGVVLISLLIHGLTMSPLLRLLGLSGGGETMIDFEFRRGSLQGARAALEELDRMERRHLASDEVLETLRNRYHERADEAREEMRGLEREPEDFRREELRAAGRRLLLREKERAIDALRQGVLGDDAYRRLQADIDARMLELEAGEEQEEKKRSESEKREGGRGASDPATADAAAVPSSAPEGRE